jgi:hypothetical protein
MALEDIIELENKKETFEIKKNKLEQIIEICESDDDFDFYLIKSKANFLIDVLKMEIIELEKYSNCDHKIIIEDILVGNDSHYDFYADKCSDCDKIIKQYKI